MALGLFAGSPAVRAADAAPADPAPSVEAIVVTAQKLSVETLIDRKVYSIADDVQSTFGTLSDVLNAIPSIDVDPDGVVSLRGDSNVLLLIDGKPSTQFSGSAAGDNLQSISAMNIDRIEVITTPPAQFKADGAAGVINIITRKQRPMGLAGSVQGSLGSGGRSVLGASSSYSSGPLTVSASAGFRHDYRARLIESDVRAPDPVTAQLLDSKSVLQERISREVPSARLSSEYALDDRRSLSASVSWSERGGLRRYTQLDSSSTTTGMLSGLSQRMSSGHDPEFDYDQKLGFSQKLGRAGETLDLSLHRSASHQREHYDYTNNAFVPPAATYYNNLSLLEDRSTTELGADCVLPLSKARSLKLGYAYEQDDFNFGNVGNNVDPVTGIQVIDPSLTHDFKFRQRIDAGYASYQESAGLWTWLAGLRAEATRTEAQQVTDNIATSRSYFGIYPSLHADRSLSDERTLSFGASRRISRPDPRNLDPYVDHEYTPNLRAGNAGLLPQYTQSYEIGYGFEGRGMSHQLTGYYRRNRDSVTDVTQYLGNGLSLTTKANLPKNDSAGLEVTSNGRITSMLAYSLSANLFHSQIDAGALGDPGLRSTNGVNAKIKLELRPTTAGTAQLIATRTDKRLTPQGYVSAINLVNIGYKHQLRPELTAILTVSDVFNGQRNERIETTPTLSADYLRAVQGRVLYLGLVYSFGATKSGKETKLEYDQPD